MEAASRQRLVGLKSEVLETIWLHLPDTQRGCNSFILGDETTAQGVVVDPLASLGAEHYILAAMDARVEIRMVVETHVHADHESCAAALAELLGVPHGLSHRAPAGYDFQPLHDGERLLWGTLGLEVWETPGHTPDSISLLVRDLRRGDMPWAALTGDSLFVGDVGRPDLAEANEAAIQRAAREQYETIRRLVELPEGTELWPAHYGASPCGGLFMSRRTHSTIGYERAANPFVKLDADAFVEQTLRLLKPPPIEAAELRRKNLGMKG